MKDFVFGLIVGLITGGAFGVVAMALLIGGGRDE